MRKVLCKQCNTEFETNHSKKSFCDRKCMRKWFDRNKEKQKQYAKNQAKNRGPQICKFCKKEFLKRDKQQFCSAECSNQSRASLDYSDCSTTKEKRAKYWRNYYNEKGKIAHKKRTREYEKATTQKLHEYKKTLKCSVCGENHPATLDFHHNSPEEKEGNVSQLNSKKGWSFARILTEIEKCTVLCSNCHRKLHYEENI